MKKVNIIVIVDGIPHVVIPLTEVNTKTPLSSPEFGLDGYVLNPLREYGGIEYIEDLWRKSRADILRVPSIGPKRVNELQAVLNTHRPGTWIGMLKEVTLPEV